MIKFATALTLGSFFLAGAVPAQDYPYEDGSGQSSGPAPTPLPRPLQDDSAGDARLPREAPRRLERRKPAPRGRAAPAPAARGYGERETRSLFFLKLGANFSLIQSETVLTPTTSKVESTKGIGGEALLGFGWDLGGEPFLAEIETGYRGQFLNQDAVLHVVPLRFGFLYRDRFSESSAWYFGPTSGLDLRMAKNTLTNKYDTAFVPNVGVSTQWDFDGFLVEIALTVHRLESGNNFVDGSTRLGFRF